MQRGQEAQTEGEIIFMPRCHGTCGPARPVGEAAAREEKWAGSTAWADWARIKGQFKIRFDSRISMDFWKLARL
jgi:hypothetical protein